MKTGHVIEFSPMGHVEAMHNDAFDLSCIGPQSITRATEIKFNEETQRWSICEPMVCVDDWGAFDAFPNADGFLSYEVARKVEVEWLNRCRLLDAPIRSIKGGFILKAVRQEFGA